MKVLCKNPSWRPYKWPSISVTESGVLKRRGGVVLQRDHPHGKKKTTEPHTVYLPQRTSLQAEDTNMYWEDVLLIRWHVSLTEQRGRVVSIPHSNMGGSVFKSWSWYQLLWWWVCVVLLSPSMQMLVQHFKLGFLLRYLHFIIQSSNHFILNLSCWKRP
jgi:hypothetical protein